MCHLQAGLSSAPQYQRSNKWAGSQARPGPHHQGAAGGEEGLQEGGGRPQGEERDGGLQGEGQGPEEDDEMISAWDRSVSQSQCREVPGWRKFCEDE